MRKASVAIQRGILYITALVLVAGYPAAVMATTQEPATDSAPAAVAPAEPSTATQQTQAPAQEGQKQDQKPEPTYMFDPTTETWSSKEWQFNPITSTYEKPPAPTIIEPKAADDTAATPTTNATQSTDKTVDTKVGVGNTVNSDATSGNAVISGNTAAGSALTGDASAVANIINSVNSSVAAGQNQKVTTFTKDIVGDVKGDIVLYPLLLKAMLEEQANGGSASSVDVKSNLDVNNNVTVNAASGSATVDGNTTAGDAKTGNATAMANVVNILNSMIAAQDSFIGTINIYGSLEGDILIAPDFIPQLLASNGGGSGSAAQLSTQDTTQIVNNISAVAESGAASVFGNTKGGSATTGDASNNVVIFNVTGHDIVAENSLLVFVNVLGRWVGMIVDAPQGTTAAMIGNGVTKDEAYAPDLTVKSRSEHGITNTIAVNARSGDAVVSNNTTGGNAVSGGARAIANVANVSGSQLSLTGWFGLLFINVMGDWLGSFGVDTAYGNAPESPTPQPAGPVQFVPQEARPKPRQFKATNLKYAVIDSRSIQRADQPAAATETDSQSNEVHAISEVRGASDTVEANENATTTAPRDLRWWIAAGSIFLVGVAILGLRRFI